MPKRYVTSAIHKHNPSHSHPQEIQSLLSQLAVESRIQYGAQKFLESLSRDDSFVPEHERDGLRRKVEAELDGCERKIAALESRVRELQSHVRESSEADASSGVDALHDSPSASSEDHTQRSIPHVPSSSTLSSSFHSSISSVPYPNGHHDALRRRAHSNATQASTASADRNERIVYGEPDQMSLISSSESGPVAVDYARAGAHTTSPRAHMRQSRQIQPESHQIRHPSSSQSRSRHGSSRGGARPVMTSEVDPSTSVLENMDALSRLANAVTTNNGIVRRQSISNESVNPFDYHLSAIPGASEGNQRQIDTIRSHAEKEERRQREYEEALGLARQVLETLGSLRHSPQSSQSKYGLAQRRPTEDTFANGDDEDTPSAARRYASFMRKEAMSGTSKDTGRQKISGSPAKLIALLTRCLKTCPDISSELDFSHLVDV